MIPEIFHLTCKSLELPADFQTNLDIIRGFYPEYDIQIHDDDAIKQFTLEHFPEYYQNTFRKMPYHIMRVDTVRYMWMYIYGGIYCDFDIRFLRHMDFSEGVIFLEREWTYPFDESITDSVHNCFFCSEPGHPVWLDILDGIATNIARLNNAFPSETRKAPQSSVFNTTGPNAISRIITDKQLIKKFNNVHVLPASVIYQQGFSKSGTDDAYVIHETAGSWKE